MKQTSQKNRSSKRAAVRLAAGVGVMSLLALSVSVGTGAAAPSGQPQAGGPPVAGVAAAAREKSQDDASLDVAVGKSVEVNADAAGEIQATGYFASTDVAGDGSETVKIPMGPNQPRNLSSVESLQVDGQSIIYDLSNQGDEVQNHLASAGTFEDELPATLDVVVKVDGEEIDPTTADSITGDVEVSYKIKNNTAKDMTVPYVDARGNRKELKTTVAIPFAVHIDVTYGDGWANIEAPFANGGMSAGQTLSGDTSLSVSPTDTDPDGEMTLTARAENAQLPAAVIFVTPHDTSGSLTSTAGDSLSSGGAKLSDALNGKAVPMLIDVQNGLGKAATDLDKTLQQKVNPALDLVSQLQVDPTETNDKIANAGETINQLVIALFGVNGGLTKLGTELGTALTDLVSEDTEAKLGEISQTLAGADEALSTLIPVVRKTGLAMKVVEPALGVTVDGLLKLKTGNPEASLEGGIRDALKDAGLKPAQIATVMATLDNLFISSTGFSLKCDDPDSTCLGEASIAQILEKMALETPEEACRTGWDTKALWALPKYKKAMNEAIASDKTDPADKAVLVELKALLDAQQKALGGPKDKVACVLAAKQLDRTLTGLLTGLTDVGDGVLDMLPVLRTLQKDLRSTNRLIQRLERRLPVVRRTLNKPCPNPAVTADLSQCGFLAAMEVVGDANAQAIDSLQNQDSELVRGIQDVVSDLFGIVNLLGAAAPGIETALADLPQGIAEIAYGPVGAFVGGLSGLGVMGEEMSQNAEKGLALNKAVDEMFAEGAAFPYGPAEGERVSTQAVYTWKLSGPEKATASTGARAGLAIVLLLIGAVAGGLLYRRAK